MMSTACSVWASVKKWAWRVFATLVCLYVVLAAIRLPYILPRELAKQDAEKIRALRITIDDVNGHRAPPMPSSEDNGKTIEGVDLNANTIRDDVEQALFAKYPFTNRRSDGTIDHAKFDANERVRAASMQYAQSQQILLTKVYDKITMQAALEHDDNAYQCLSSTLPELSEETRNDNAKIREALKLRNLVFDPMIKFIEEVTTNTSARKEKRKHIYTSFMTSYGELPTKGCNIIGL
jgi:hypothetical protein